MVFDVEFEHENDTVFFAFSQPFAYTEIVHMMLQQEQNALSTGAQLYSSNIKQTQFF